MKSERSMFMVTGAAEQKVLVATRVHRKHDGTSLEGIVSDQLTTKLRSFVLHSFSAYAPHLAIAYPAEDTGLRHLLAHIAHDITPPNQLHILPIQNWGHFIMPLNALLHLVVQLGMSCICFASVEVIMDQNQATRIYQQLDENTLVAGKAFPQQHEFNPGIQKLTGLTTPWNTFAAWNVAKLALVGFLYASEGDRTGEMGGVEEVAVIALLQKLWGPDQMKAKLIQTSQTTTEWKTQELETPERLAWQERKMKSKLSRPMYQLNMLNLEGEGIVEHLIKYTMDSE